MKDNRIEFFVNCWGHFQGQGHTYGPGYTFSFGKKNSTTQRQVTHRPHIKPLGYLLCYWVKFVFFCSQTRSPVTSPTRFSPAVSHRVLDVIGAVCRVQTARPPGRGSVRKPEVQIGDSREAAAAERVRFYQPVGPVDVDVQEIDGTEGEGGDDTTVHAPHQHRET